MNRKPCEQRGAEGGNRAYGLVLGEQQVHGYIAVCHSPRRRQGCIRTLRSLRMYLRRVCACPSESYRLDEVKVVGTKLFWARSGCSALDEDVRVVNAPPNAITRSMRVTLSSGTRAPRLAEKANPRVKGTSWATRRGPRRLSMSVTCKEWSVVRIWREEQFGTLCSLCSHGSLDTEASAQVQIASSTSDTPFLLLTARYSMYSSSSVFCRERLGTPALSLRAQR